MPYIGNTSPSRFVSNRAASVYSGDGSTTAFTLEQAVVQDEDILVSVDGVVQEPSVAYAVSNATTLTFTAAPSSNSGNNIFVYYLASQVGTVGHPSNQALNATTGTFSGAITGGGLLTTGGNVVIPDAGNIGSASDTDAMAISSGGVVNFTQTPTYASTKDPFNSVIEMFYYDSTSRVHTNNTVLNQAWTRITSNLTANKNVGMSASSGIWTFPSTGTWLVCLEYSWQSSQAATFEGVGLYTTGDNSSYTEAQRKFQHSNAGSQYSSVSMPFYLNITDTTNQKIKWQVATQHQVTVQGGSAGGYSTKAQFVKICPSH